MNTYLFFFDHEGREGWTFTIQANNYDEAFDKAYDTHGPQVEDMLYELIEPAIDYNKALIKELLK